MSPQPQEQVDAPPPEELPVQPPVLVENTPPPQQSVRQAPQRPGQQPGAPASGRVYVVQPKDTLFKISTKVYGTNTRWRDIYAANRDRMKSETDLKIGMELRMP